MPALGWRRQARGGAMCGRVNIEGPALGEALAVAWPEASGWPLADVYGDAQINVAPQAWVPVLRQDGTLARQRWWFPAPPSAGAGLTTFNARCERALASPLYGPWLPTHRCVFPVTSFMEWWRLPDGRRLPYLLRSPTPAPLYLAGVGRPALSSNAPGADGGEAGGFAVLTCPARPQLQWLHHREPRLLTLAGARAWLGGLAPEVLARGLAAPQAAVPLEALPLGPAVGDARQRDRALLEPLGAPWVFGDPAPEPPAAAQGGLF
jgi:putative SOS response-associated peptidase YedK